MVSWLHDKAMPELRIFCNDGESRLDCEEKPAGTVVRIVTPIFILLDVDTELHDIMRRATIMGIKANEDKSIMVEMWFRAWKWQEKI